MLILGTIINGCAILLGGGIGLILRKSPSEGSQSSLRTILGMITVLAGLHLAWSHLHGGFLSSLKQLFTAFLALGLGNVAGRALGIQNGSNRLGRYAGATLERAATTGKFTFSEGFLTCTVLFCVAPLTFLGAVQEGLGGDWRSFAIKAVVDGLAAMSFASIFGGRVLLVLVPTVAWQGSLTLAVTSVAPWLNTHGLAGSVLITSGLLLCCVSVLILQVQKVRVADYFPGLLIAPLLTWLWG